MENLSLYDLLVGCFINKGDRPGEVSKDYLESLSEEEKLRSSIVENLTMILQTQQGTVPHLPDFGVPDIRQIYFNEGTLDPVPRLIRNTILKNEPRLADVQVRIQEFDVKSLRVTFEIIAKIKAHSGKEVLLTEFSSTGWVKVMFEKDRKSSNG